MTESLDVAFEPITAEVIREIEPWFDDPETQRYLGGRPWLLRTLALVQEAAGVEFRGQRVLARHVWIVREAGTACALVDVERYDDGTAAIALVVAPSMRGKGMGRRALLALAQRVELVAVQVFIGAIEPANTAAKRCVIGARFDVADREDEEGMLCISRRAT